MIEGRLGAIGARGGSASFFAVAFLLVASVAPPASAGPGGRELYLASRDDMRRVERILDRVPASRGGTFIGIVGGLAALNFVERLEPRRILLVDLNPEQVEYGRCVVALIGRAKTREDFVAALFSRPFLDDEVAFLAQPGDEAMLRASVAGIGDAGLRASCHEDLAMIARATYDADRAALVVARNKNGRYLQRGGPDKGMPGGFNFLYYGRGWLASDDSYQRTRATLRRAEVRFLASDIGIVPVDDLRGPDVFFWGTNLATWVREGREAYERFVIRVHEALSARNEAARFVFTSTYRFPAWTDFVPFEKRGDGIHLDASAKVKRHAQGKRVLELIPGTAYFGRELRAAENTVQSAALPIDPAASFDVAVLHLLNNSGLRWWREDRDAEFRSLYEEVLGRAREVVILEHDRRSADFDEAQRARMVGLDALLGPLFPLLAKRRLTIAIEPALGDLDDGRNLVFHVARP